MDPEATAYLALATTGLKGYPVNVAMVDHQGQTIADLLIRSPVAIEAEASRINGVDDAMLQERGRAPGDVAAWLAQLRCLTVAFNPEFIEESWQRLAQRTPDASLGAEAASQYLDGQGLLSAAWGTFNVTRKRFIPIKLTEACDAAGIDARGMKRAGRALGNAQRLQAAISAAARLRPSAAWLEQDLPPNLEDMFQRHPKDEIDRLEQRDAVYAYSRSLEAEPDAGDIPGLEDMLGERH